MPAMALPIELRPEMPVTLFRFAAPGPSRAIGLVWRRSSPRRQDFEALGAVLAEVGRGAGMLSNAAARADVIALPAAR